MTFSRPPPLLGVAIVLASCSSSKASAPTDGATTAAPVGAKPAGASDASDGAPSLTGAPIVPTPAVEPSAAGPLLGPGDDAEPIAGPNPEPSPPDNTGGAGTDDGMLDPPDDGDGGDGDGGAENPNAPVTPPPPLADPITPVFRRRQIDDGIKNRGIAVGEFTGDDLNDIITTDAVSGAAFLYAAPTFERRNIGRGLDGIHGVTMDVDQDGDDDAVFVRFSPGDVFWLEQPANALTSSSWERHTIDSFNSGGAGEIHGVAKADIDGDGDMEILATAGAQNSVYLYFAPDDPTTPWHRQRLADGDAPARTHYVGTGDLNGDGRLDAAAGGTDGNFFAWWEQPAALGEPWTKHHLSDEEGATQIVMTDINRDQQMDLLAARGHGLGLLWYEGPTFIARPLDDTMSRPHALDHADLDLDGDIDVVAVSAGTSGAAWFENDGQGQFTKHLLDNDQQSYQVQVADLGADGDLDLVMSGFPGEDLVIFENSAAD